MRKPDLTTLILAAGTAALAYALAQTLCRLEAAEGEAGDLYWEAEDERQCVELMRDELAAANKRVAHLDTEWRAAVSKLGQARTEISGLREMGVLLAEARAAEVARMAERQQASGWWVQVATRLPAGPFDDVEVARAEAESLTALYPGEDVHLLAGVDRVRVTERRQMSWDVGLSSPASV